MRLAFLVIGFLLCSAAIAEIGSVTEQSGLALVKRGKETITVKLGTPIELNDKVETKNGKVKITFKDNTVVNVTESSTLVIDDFVYDPKSGSGKLNLKAAAGTVRYASGNIAHNNPNAVNIKTPTAAIAVRGTDFVMSVNEVGSSMVMLMPSCESSPLGSECKSGKIDVNTAHGTVSMDRPYQATLVETASTPPSPPVTVNLNGATIGNNLMISPPKTMGGLSVIAAARAAAEKTGDSKKEDKKDKKDDTKDDGKSEAVAHNQQTQQDKIRQQESAQEDSDATANQKIVNGIDVKSFGNVKDAGTGDPNVYKIWKDKSETQQVGWGYSLLSPNSNNYVNVSLTMDTKAMIIVTQDRITDAYNFNVNSTKAYGLIVINQNHK